MEIPKSKQALLALAVIAVALRPLAAQNEARLQDSGLTFTIRGMMLEHEESRVVFRAILDNRTETDWYMRSATITVNAECQKRPKRLDFSVHFTNSDLLLTALSAGDSIKPGQNDIEASVRADPTCKLGSLGPVRFKSLRPVDASTQGKLDADRRLRRAVDELNALRPKLDQYRKETCHEVFNLTATKKVSDLTVIEAQDVRSCQEVGYYK